MISSTSDMCSTVDLSYWWKERVNVQHIHFLIMNELFVLVVLQTLLDDIYLGFYRRFHQIYYKDHIRDIITFPDYFRYTPADDRTQFIAQLQLRSDPHKTELHHCVHFESCEIYIFVISCIPQTSIFFTDRNLEQGASMKCYAWDVCHRSSEETR